MMKVVALIAARRHSRMVMARALDGTSSVLTESPVAALLAPDAIDALPYRVPGGDMDVASASIRVQFRRDRHCSTLFVNESSRLCLYC